MEKSTNQLQSHPMDIEDCSSQNITLVATLKPKFIKFFIKIIKLMQFGNATEIRASHNGLKFVVGDSASFNATANFMKEFFEIFFLKLSQQSLVISFEVNLEPFVELLENFHDVILISMCIVYYQDKNLLSFSFTEMDFDEEPLMNEIRTEYFMKTSCVTSSTTCGINNVKLLNAAVINVQDFCNIIDGFSSAVDYLKVKVSTEKMILETVGSLQSLAYRKVKIGREVFDKFEFISNSKFTYKLEDFKKIREVLNAANLVVITTLGSGIMKITLAMEIDGKRLKNFVMEFNFQSADDKINNLN